MLHVGQKVVFIGDMSPYVGSFWAVELGLRFPETNAVYTIRAMVQRPGGQAEYGLLLHEIVNPETPLAKGEDSGGIYDSDDPRLTHGEIAFDAREFRPLITIESIGGTTTREPVTA